MNFSVANPSSAPRFGAVHILSKAQTKVLTNEIARASDHSASDAFLVRLTKDDNISSRNECLPVNLTDGRLVIFTNTGHDDAQAFFDQLQEGEIRACMSARASAQADKVVQRYLSNRGNIQPSINHIA